MRVLYFDAFAGVSGDMTVGALLALGLDLEHLRESLATLPVRGYALHASQRRVNASTAVKFDVALDGHDDAPAHSHRSFAEIRAMIEGSSLVSPVKATALAIFGRLGRMWGPWLMTFNPSPAGNIFKPNRTAA